MLGKMLILDHRSSWSRFAAETLSARGYDPLRVEHQEEALALLEKAAREGEEYSLIIVDPLNGRIEDPGIKPMEVAGTIAKLFPQLPLIVASSRPTPDEAVLAYEIGASNYIPKTCDESQLMESVEKIIHRAHSHS